jgi:hypothetical protein
VSEYLNKSGLFLCPLSNNFRNRGLLYYVPHLNDSPNQGFFFCQQSHFDSPGPTPFAWISGVLPLSLSPCLICSLQLRGGRRGLGDFEYLICSCSLCSASPYLICSLQLGGGRGGGGEDFEYLLVLFMFGLQCTFCWWFLLLAWT